MYILTVFSNNMKKYRKQANLSQEKLAELCNTDFRYIGQIETGRRCPSLEFVEKIASALNIPPYRLFYDEANMNEEGITSLLNEQKQKIKEILQENTSKICAIIGEQY